MNQGQTSEGVRKYIREAEKDLQRQKERLSEVRKMRFDTLAVHGLYGVREALDKGQGSIIEPVYLSTSQAYKDSDEMEAGLAYLIPNWCYSRIANPTIGYLEQTIALLEAYGFEGEASALCTASGMAAVFQAVDPLLAIGKGEKNGGINFVATAQCYGGTFQQFQIRKMQERGIEVRWVRRGWETKEWEEKVDRNTRFLYGEMPSNPQLGCLDIEKVAALAHANGIPLIVDSTVATPALMRPLCHGADIVIQSCTKSMTTSGFAIGGAVIARKNLTSRHLEEEAGKDYATWLKLWPFRDNGPCYSPFSAILQLNDLRFLRNRMRILSENTLTVARFLAGHPKVEKVEYLGLSSHPLHALASRYMKVVDSDDGTGKPVNAYGHLFSFLVAGGAPAARRFFDALGLIFRATDLGRIKSVATIPAISTHQQQGEEGRELAGVPANLVRLCIGAEDPEDIMKDLDQALRKA
jgi:O-acetylhomoserine/O-acetylserine sulfhydrylase-like pyridoxal-dependent enzyme